MWIILRLLSSEPQIFTARSHSTYAFHNHLFFHTANLKTHPYEPFRAIFGGCCWICYTKRVLFTSEPFAQDILPILDSRKSLFGYICQVLMEGCPSLMYSKNNIKAVQTGWGFSVLQLLSLTIIHTTFLGRWYQMRALCDHRWCGSYLCALS